MYSHTVVFFSSPQLLERTNSVFEESDSGATKSPLHLAVSEMLWEASACYKRTLSVPKTRLLLKGKHSNAVITHNEHSTWLKPQAAETDVTPIPIPVSPTGDFHITHLV